MADISIPSDTHYYRLTVRVQGIPYDMYANHIYPENLQAEIDNYRSRKGHSIVKIESILIKVEVVDATGWML